MVAHLAPIQAEIVISSGCKQQIHVTDPAQIDNEEVRKERHQIDGACRSVAPQSGGSPPNRVWVSDRISTFDMVNNLDSPD
jgi:hypothetical protein